MDRFLTPKKDLIFHLVDMCRHADIEQKQGRKVYLFMTKSTIGIEPLRFANNTFNFRLMNFVCSPAFVEGECGGVQSIERTKLRSLGSGF